MNEIEKMYEKFGIEKEYECNARFCYGELNACPLWCKNCENLISFYPPFTTEKQIELIKWLSDTDYYIHNLYKTIDTKEYCIENDFYNVQANEFEEALASLINKLWHFLTEKEKQQVKGILK